MAEVLVVLLVVLTNKLVFVLFCAKLPWSFDREKGQHRSFASFSVVYMLPLYPDEHDKKVVVSLFGRQ